MADLQVSDFDVDSAQPICLYAGVVIAGKHLAVVLGGKFTANGRGQRRVRDSGFVIGDDVQVQYLSARPSAVHP
jgi:hypothetical protein